MRLAYWNAGLWAVGNGLASTLLVVYLALEYGARGLAISLILAAPRLAGLLRMGVPPLLRRVGRRKAMCLAGFAMSSALLLALPIVSAPGVLGSDTTALAALVLLWSGYHLLEYSATVALWSWLGDVAPRRVRGRFIGRRERWLTLGRIAGMLGCGLLAYGWEQLLPDQPGWIAYAVPAALGALAMALSLLPLAAMPAFADTLAATPGPSLAELAAPLRDRRFLGLLVFGCWFSTCNGLTQAAQSIYPKSVLGISLLWLLALQCLMRLGQSGISPAVGRFCDRYGNRPAMIAAQFVVALGPLFYLLATPSAPGWIALGWAAWIAYAGLNVGLPNLTLKFGGPRHAASYIATFFAVTGVFYGVSTVLGGIAWDWLREDARSAAWASGALDAFGYLFVLGAAGRMLGVPLLMRIREPGAWRWPEILRR